MAIKDRGKLLVANKSLFLLHPLIRSRLLINVRHVFIYMYTYLYLTVNMEKLYRYLNDSRCKKRLKKIIISFLAFPIYIGTHKNKFVPARSCLYTFIKYMFNTVNGQLSEYPEMVNLTGQFTLTTMLTHACVF